MKGAYLYAYVTKGDHGRLTALAAEMHMSLSAFLRMCVDDWLEQEDERPLTEIKKPGEHGPPALSRPQEIA